MFYFDYIEGKRVIKSDLLSDLDHFFTTRDLCIYSKTEDMSKNRKIVENYFNQKLAMCHPIHGVNIEKIEEGKYFYNNTDGLLVENKGACSLNFGDCTPLVFHVKNIAMISHAGWRGTALCMAKESVKKLVTEYNVKTEDIKVAIGPTICFDCYNVGEEVYNSLSKTIKNSKKLFKIENGKYFVDLKGINKQQLIECGVLDKNIDVCPYCTACGEKIFFSYRYENQTGYRHSAIIKL